jgi:hypothetical protein
MTNETIKPTKKIASKLLAIVDAGMCSGLGQPVPGEMCIIATKRYAFGLSHSDKLDGLPVGTALRALDIPLNDSLWSNNAARAKGMRRLAIAEIGSDTLDQREFSRLLALRVTQKLLPASLRDYAKYCKPEFVNQLVRIADQCEQSITDADVKSSLDSLDSLDKLDRDQLP